MFSRDERLTRASARPPVIRRAGRRRAIMPIDADRGGTWIAVTDAGIVLALLNVTSRSVRGRVAPTPGRTPPESRGAIIPALVACGSLDEVVTRLRALDARRYGPFRLLAVSREQVVDARSNGVRVTIRRLALIGPLFRTSSSLGDRRVLGPRLALFRRMVASRPCPSAQDVFHRHHWPDRPHLSVSMARPDARTVSITTVEVGRSFVVMRYEPADGPTVVRRLRRDQASAP